MSAASSALPPDLEKKRRSLEAERRIRLLRLGVSERALDQSELGALPSNSDEGTIRLMQWNLLADGLSDDGFLVRPVLEEWPTGTSQVPTADGEAVEFVQLLEEMTAARGDDAALRQLQSKYDVQVAKKNTAVVVDWEARMLQIQLTVLAAGRPEVLVLQELDHYSTLASALADLGYTSRLPGTARVYEPAHLSGHDCRSEDGARRFLRDWEGRGHAFLPDLGSSCMRLALTRHGFARRICSAAESLGLAEKVVDSGGANSGKLHKSALLGIPGGSGELLKAAGISNPSDVDDMGVGIFWCADLFVAERMKMHVYPDGEGGLLQVCLRQRIGKHRGQEFVVAGTHLRSGDSQDDEERRLKQQVNVAGGLCPVVTDTLKQQPCLPFVLAMDANSCPEQAGRDGRSSVWRSLHHAIGASVWDSHYDMSGARRAGGGSDGLGPPVTSNKCRGPLSGQARKIGLHSFYLIDHVFFNPNALELRGHVRRPDRFTSSAAAREVVQPSLVNPSDHYPVVVDLAWVRPNRKLLWVALGVGVVAVVGGAVFPLWIPLGITMT